MKILVTGAAGFIGAAISARLLTLGHTVVGLDNLNDYYDSRLKQQRLAQIHLLRGCTTSAFAFIQQDITDQAALLGVFEREKFDVVVHLAAQAGVRHSLVAPHDYLTANMQGFLNVLECCRYVPVQHLLYASSSSVYGQNASIPFSVEDKTDAPLSLYAASKKSNELMAYSYSHLFGMPTTGLRFFTVYGPWGRPDMAPMLFAEAMLNNQPIAVFNHGKMRRDFTYIDDIVSSVVQLLPLAPPATTDGGTVVVPSRILNCGRGSPVDLLVFIQLLAAALERKPMLDFQDMQAGDVPVTWADTRPLEVLTQFKPRVAVEEGVAQFAAWFMAWKNNRLEKSDYP
jgi:UDP-glucuronate 4-epimerase